MHVTLRPDVFGEKELAGLREVLSRFSGERDLVFHWRENGRDRYVVRSGNTRVLPGLDLFKELKAISGVEHVKIQF